MKMASSFFKIKFIEVFFISKWRSYFLVREPYPIQRLDEMINKLVSKRLNSVHSCLTRRSATPIHDKFEFKLQRSVVS